ncbi:MAG: RteC domain-containing protein [Bacteroidetes bacterium]|nr:RteC domain-containing protein [Bacteroidota bacterium]
MGKLDSLFNTMLERYMKAMERDIKYRLSRAKDREYVYNEIRKELDFILDLVRADEHREGFVEAFLIHYRRGEPVDKILKLLRDSYGDKEDIRPFKLLEDGKEITLYISEEEKKLRALARNDREMIRYFVRHVAQMELKRRLPALLEEVKAGSKVSKSSTAYKIQWTGKKDNRNEFVQLIYGMHEAGFLNNGKGEITKIVETLAEVFDVKLSSNWQSNLSKSIHNATSNYEPEIFDTIKSAYAGYCAKKRKEKRQNRMEL